MAYHQEYFTGLHPFDTNRSRRYRLPSSWRNAYSGPLYMCLGHGFKLPMISVMHPSVLHKLHKKIDGLPLTTWLKKMESKEITSNQYRLIQFNHSARLTLPQIWAEQAGIRFPGKIMLGGRGLSIEIWSHENFNKMWKILTEGNDEEDIGIF